MPNPSFLLFFVDSPAASATFYGDLFGLAPVEQSPTFALFALSSGLRLGLWSKHTAEPRPGAGAGGTELGLTVEDQAEVDATHADWKGRGIAILQPPIEMDFGRTFVALDPDGHRLRVFAPA